MNKLYIIRDPLCYIGSQYMDTYTKINFISSLPLITGKIKLNKSDINIIIKELKKSTRRPIVCTCGDVLQYKSYKNHIEYSNSHKKKCKILKLKCFMCKKKYGTKKRVVYDKSMRTELEYCQFYATYIGSKKVMCGICRGKSIALNYKKV